jgi:glycosyltransferase involved in cell wall biosynthesis
MRLGVNVVRLTRSFTGVGRFVECVLDEWSRMELPFERVTLYAPRPIDPASVVFPLDRYDLVTGGPQGPDPLWEASFLGRRRTEMDVLFAPSYTIPVGYRGRCVVGYHGPSENRPLSYEWCRSLAYDQLHRYSARRADRVIACSRVVKRRVVDVFQVPAARVTVAYPAPSRLFRPVQDEGAKAQARHRYVGGPAPFTLFVGKLARRHSIPELIRAFARARRTSPQHRLVLAGPDDLGLDVPRLARDEGIGDAVVHHPFIPHAELPALYAAAEEAVFPVTEAEGFGLPVIEAMACGTPVLSVSQGSGPEFATGAALLVATSSAEDLAGGLERLMQDRSLRQDLSEKGMARAREITWRKTAERVLAALEAAARGVPA